MKNKEDITQLLSSKQFKAIEDIVDLAVSQPEVLGWILEGLQSSEDTLRFNCFEVLLHIAEQVPSLLYPHWQYFMDMLSSSNAYHRSIGLRMIAALTAVDVKKRFDETFEDFFELLYDDKVMVARYLVQSIPGIFAFKPYLTQKIVDRLFEIEHGSKPRSQKDLVCADIIEALAQIYEDYPDQRKIIAFVQRQCDSSSPKARKAARDFLKIHSG